MRIDHHTGVGLLIEAHPETAEVFERRVPGLDATDRAMSLRGFCERRGCDPRDLLKELTEAAIPAVRIDWPEE
jgi:hypothetical protein